MKTFLIKYRKVIIWIIIGLVVFFVIRKNWWKIKSWIQPRDLNVEGGQTTVEPSRKPYLDALAKKLYDDIYNTPLTGHTEALYKEADVLSDVELLSLSRFYKRSLTQGVSLYEDINNERFSPFGSTIDAAGSLMAHLSKIGER